jgi:hypothetical protein
MRKKVLILILTNIVLWFFLALVFSTLSLSRPTVGFTRAAGLVKELPPQEQLQARVDADFKRR